MRVVISRYELIAGETGESAEKGGQNGDGVRDRFCSVFLPSTRVHAVVLYSSNSAEGLQRVLALFSDPQLLPGVHQQLHQSHCFILRQRHV